MKKYIFGIIIAIIAIVLIIIGVYFYNIHNNQKILENENNQVEVLKGVYEDLINSFGFENSYVILNENCFKNIITDVEFSDENKQKLKQVEIINDTYDFKYEIFAKYNKENSSLSLEIKEIDNNLMTGTQKYKLYVENGAIQFKRDGVGKFINTSPVNV